MADWSTLSIHFDPFAPLRPPIQAALQILETVQAILEALLDLIKAFLLDLLNPILALIALLLAAVRAIINQLQATGFAILLVHPNFGAQDIGAVFQSVSGSYPAFQSKVFAKFYDSSDIFRPMYPPGSAVAMLILYIGEDSPGDLMTQLLALLNFFKHPNFLMALPAPVELTVKPVFQSGDAVQQFADLFSSIGSGPQSYAKQLVLEWRMPNAPLGVNQPSFISHLTSFVNAPRFPQFVVERSTTPTGENVMVEPKNGISNTQLTPLMQKYNFPTPTGMVDMREENGNVYRNFATKIEVSGAELVSGFATGTYRYVDKDPNLVAGVTYYYRVRAYFGNPSAWLATSTLVTGSPDNGFIEQEAIQSAVDAIATNQTLRKDSGNKVFIRYGDGVIMGLPSPVVKGMVPPGWPDSGNFNPYTNINDAVQAAVLLNFELPPAQSGDSPFTQQQKTGWGTIGQLAGQMGPLKKAINDSQAIFGNIIFQSTCRRLSNSALANMNVQLQNVLAKQWNTKVQNNDGSQQPLSHTIDKILGVQGGTNPNATTTVLAKISPAGASNRPGPPVSWKFPGIVNGYSPTSQAAIATYLAQEQTYASGKPLTGPLPVGTSYTFGNSGDISVSAEERTALAQFLTTCVSATAGVGYLSWYSVTLGDMFPAFIPFIYDLEQFLLALMKALQSIIAEIEAIIQTIIQKIQQIEDLLNTILQLLELLDITLNLSILGYSNVNGSADDLAQALIASGSKPGTSPFGLHSGLVMTFGGPGQGFIAAFQALAFIMSAGQL
jgi:hypothetical protein